MVGVYQVIALVFIFLGTLASNDLVWELSDMFLLKAIEIIARSLRAAVAIDPTLNGEIPSTKGML